MNSNTTSYIGGIAAIVVTYNRLNLLKGCISALQKQSRVPDKIIVVNNGSTDGTAGWLEAQPELLVIYQQNLGGAGGFNTGVKAAFDFGYDWIWIMDDDCEVAPDCLEQMMHSASSAKVGAVAPLVLNSDGKADVRHRGFFNLCVSNESVLQPVNESVANETLIDFASFVGLMISAKVVRQIGFPRADFFIHNDDVEYCIRLRKVSKILLCKEAKIYHLENTVNSNIERKFFNHHRERPPLEKLWIRYYGVRNGVWIKKRYMVRGSAKNLFGLGVFILKAYSEHFKDIVLYDDHKIKRLRFYLHAYIDGWRGCFKNDKAKTLLGLPLK